MVTSRFTTINTFGHVSENTKKLWLKLTNVAPCENRYYTLIVVLTPELLQYVDT